jgi:hypothetical protein
MKLVNPMSIALKFNGSKFAKFNLLGESVAWFCSWLWGWWYHFRIDENDGQKHGGSNWMPDGVGDAGGVGQLSLAFGCGCAG